MKMKVKTICKRLLFASIPVLIFLGLAEVGVRVLPIAAIRDEAYFAGFPGCPAYFERVAGPEGRPVYRTVPGKGIARTSFPGRKPAGERRIFVLGDSAVYGDPYGHRGSFPFWLEEILNGAGSESRYRVINCGRQGFGSVRVANIFDEIIEYDPDVVVVYFGNNEKRDQLFHPVELFVERHPLLRSLKNLCDSSRLFRIVFHAVFKKKIDSHGARSLSGVARKTTFNERVFASQVESIRKLRTVLDADHGGTWVPRGLDPGRLSSEDLERYRRQLMENGVWTPSLADTFRRNVEHIVAVCKRRRVPLIFCTRTINLYYNRDARVLFERFDAANAVVRGVCGREEVPVVDTLRALREHFRDEIGFNAFIDSKHPTVAASRVIAGELARALVEQGIFPELESGLVEAARQRILQRPEGSLENSRSCSKRSYQKLILLEGAPDRPREVKEIVELAERALDLDPDNGQAYLVLGAVHRMTENLAGARHAWEEIRKRFGPLARW